MEKIYDEVLGNLQYHHLWRGGCVVYLWGKNRTLSIEVQASSGQLVTEEQKKSFIAFKKRLSDIDAARTDVRRYCAQDTSKEGISSDLERIVIPRSLFLPRNGGFGLLCDYSYDECGLAIFCLVSDGPLEIGPEDAIL